ncbi:hypothetical protein OCH239_05315 [Roseivivax halodurans JCM 10272]|uniref:Uncharacterized protein n=2 Tax=Roseivivax halodurans TaxID=93683 RepID=X7EDW1_9RHOB|nr:hypothetical protein OCH239_05315 [Roseivivax halodurans JCM 10272]
MFSTPLWRSSGLPDGMGGPGVVKAELEKLGGAFDFWTRWYRAAFEGKPLELEFQRRIATEVEDKDWTGEDAPQKVAKRIGEIEDEMRDERPASVPDLDAQRLATHVRKLLENPKMTLITAEGAADQTERAIRAYLREAPANDLPEELQHLHALPEHFRSVARIVRTDQTKQMKIDALTRAIEALNADVAKLESDLRIARSKTLNGRFKIKAMEALGTTVCSLPFIAGLAFASSHFFGFELSDLTLENYREWSSDSQNAEPAPEAKIEYRPTLPDARDV